MEKGSNSEYWIKKIERNREHDAETDKSLCAMGWTVLRFWGKDILKHTDECIRIVEEAVIETKMQAEGLVEIE